MYQKKAEELPKKGKFVCWPGLLARPFDREGLAAVKALLILNPVLTAITALLRPVLSTYQAAAAHLC